jgi:hypothetical protein
MDANSNRHFGRDTQGRFAKGNHGGPGRLPRVTETTYLRAMHECVSLEDWRRITLQAVRDALNGDAKARDWLSKYLLPVREIEAANNRRGPVTINVRYEQPMPTCRTTPPAPVTSQPRRTPLPPSGDLPVPVYNPSVGPPRW